jgi:hypothetical protein
MHGARAALPVIATLLCSGERDRFANAIQQRCSRINVQLVVLAIDTQSNGNRAVDWGATDCAIGCLLDGATYR